MTDRPGRRRSGEARSRRVRTATESLLSIVLGLEACMIFFATLVVFGLDQLPALPALAGGGALLLVLVAAAGAVRYPAGVWIGWVLQAVILASGFIAPVMFFVGAVFVGIWIYCFVTGRRLDRHRPSAEHPDADHPSTDAPPVDAPTVDDPTADRPRTEEENP